MIDESDKVLADALHDAVTAALPAQARYAVVWVITDAAGHLNLETAELNTVANVGTDVLQRFGRMMSSRPTETIVLAHSIGSS